MPAATLQAPAPTPAPNNKTTATQSPRPSTRALQDMSASMGGPAVQLSPQRTAATTSEEGKRLYRTSDGRMVELPPDITHEEAASLEAEAKAAEAKLGKGPPPKPVPDVKKLAKKEEKKEKPKPAARGKKDGRGRGKAAPKAGGAAAALLKVGPGKVAQYLAAKGTPVLFKGIGMLQKLKQNEQTHDDAGEKLQQSEKSVVIPPSEGQSKSNTGQVDTVSGRPAPSADENKGKQKLQESLQENIPRSIEDVDNFKRDQKAQHMGADVMKVVQGDKNAVISTFADMEQTPPPAPPEHTPEALPPEEVAPPTATMNLGQGAVAPLQKEHTDLSNYTKEADSKLKEEGVTQEQLDMVDSGDLAAANKEKKGMETAAKTEPLAVQKFAQQETDKVDKDLKQEEKKERDGLRAKRKANLGTTTQKQKGAKSALEKKREEVASKINGIFKAAQDKVKRKLADLETQSMKRFDDGNAKATKEFEDNVKREMDAYKKDRYSGFWGDLKRLKDWWRGMDDLPGVKAIFERNRATFVNTINKLVEDITADNKRVIQECKDELANAKQAIKDYVDKLEPGLKDIGKKAAEEMDAKLDELDRFVAKKEQELQDKLKDKQQAAIKAIDEKIEKMKEAMAGALAKLGKLLLWAAKKFFTWALGKFGFSLADIEGIINKGVAVLKAIFTQPIRFVKNLVKAASTGFQNFGKNFLTHLKDAVFEWLTGALEGVRLPQSWDLKGILSVVFQILGLTYQNIRSHLVKLIPEPVVKTLETTFTLVKTLITDGPMAAWEQLKEIAGEMKEAFIDAVKDWIKWKVVEEAIKTVLAIFVPGAGIIRAIIAIYDTIVFFIQKAKDIMQMIGNFLGSIADIAAGNIGAAATALENGLARGLKLVIDFLARFLRLSGITKRIQGAIQKIRGKVDAVIEKVAKWVVAQARRLGRFVAQAGVPQDPNERLRLAAQAAVAAARRLTGRITQSLLNPILQGIRLRYGLREIQPYEQGGNWWVRAAINPTVSQNLGVPSTPTGKTTEAETTTEAEPTDLRGGEFVTILEPTLTRAGQPSYSNGGYYVYRKIFDNRWRIFYQDPRFRSDPSFNQLKLTKRGTEGGSRVLANALAYKADRTTKNYQIAGAPPGIPIEKDNTMVNGKPESVYIQPLYWDEKYRTPGSSSPTGWARLKSSVIEPTVGTSSDSRWVRGHLINGQMGGPGAEWNLVPMTGQVNQQMSNGHEAFLRPLVQSNRWFWYRARVNYYNNSESPDVPNISVFPKQVIVAFMEINRVGNAWQNLPSLRRYTYAIRKPRADELK